MKTTAKDVILLCKGWYDKSKYPTTLDALKEYYRKYYSTEHEEYLNEEFILRAILFEVMSEIGRLYPDRLPGFVNLYLRPRADSMFLFDVDDKNDNYYKHMFYRITAFLASLTMSSDGRIEIDTTDYFVTLVSPETESEVCSHRVLKNDII